ncbi:hypothetical protein YC2023_036446 [Brassica napus]
MDNGLSSLFVNGLYQEALSKYALALELVPEFPECTELRSICRLNRGVCLSEEELQLLCEYSLFGRDWPNKTAIRIGSNEEVIASQASHLKEMGNSILGRFGKSMDNFKAVKDPNTGSYSLSFQNWSLYHYVVLSTT